MENEEFQLTRSELDKLVEYVTGYSIGFVSQLCEEPEILTNEESCKLTAEARVAAYSFLKQLLRS